MLRADTTRFVEDSYEIAEEAKNASLFTTGNGYIGVRGSFEEYGSIRVQGAYIRGVIDEIIEVMEPFADNEYMKKYYIDEERLREFEYQDSVINNADFLLLRVSVDVETFYPWEGKVLFWERYLDMTNATLVRKVKWENTKGDVTEFEFKRFSSFANDHIYCIQVEITPLNHNKPISVISGIDTRVKTGGQKVTTVLTGDVHNETVYVNMSMGKKYGFETAITATSRLFGTDANWTSYEDKGIFAVKTDFDCKTGEKYTVEKNIYIASSREENVKTETVLKKRYNEYFDEHLIEYKKEYDLANIEIDGDVKADTGVRFANYHSLISAPRNDNVHSIAAKGLTGEKYNDFVWWDCEIYQLPIFIHTNPETARNALIYRYNCLEKAKENAKEAGFKGAKYAFCSSVEGDERVWIYARHPFMQIHINADIAWGIINYVTVTGDKEFLKDYGIKMLTELCEYWCSRVTEVNGRYEILRVTGTDEHHPYVNNDAYTNYLVKYVLEKTTEYCSELGIDKDYTDIAEKLYQPMDENGLIPQFDGYFDLSRALEETSGSSATGFQMKKSGLYHKSQIIKQPDVMLIYSYLNMKPKNGNYAANWDYYEQMCESSSSLSFAPHSICAADNGRMLSAYNYLIETAYIDIYDIHNCAWQGVHSGCLVGAWYAVVRGIGGIVCRDDAIEINPHQMMWWNKLKFNFKYKGDVYTVTMNGRDYVLTTEKESDTVIIFNGEKKTVNKNKKLSEKI